MHNNEVELNYVSFSEQIYTVDGNKEGKKNNLSK